jgi:lactocepin
MNITFDAKLWRAWDCKGEVNIPSFVESIDEYAFYSSESMTKLNVPASVEKIDSIFFDGATSLTEINVDPKNEKYSSVDGVLFNKDKTLLVLYPSGKAADRYVVPNSVRTINNSAFLGAKVKEIVLSPDLDSIGFGTFTRSEIQTLTIPKNFNGWIPSGAFRQTSKLASITVESGNEKYSNKNGVLYSKDGTILYLYPIAKSGTSFVVPEGVEEIDAYAFQNSLITSITLPSTLKTIGYEAFGDSKIENLAIPASTNISEAYPFTYLKSLKSITIDSANASAIIKDGVIYSKDLTKLILVPPTLDSKSYTVPSGVKQIDFSAFK